MCSIPGSAWQDGSLDERFRRRDDRRTRPLVASARRARRATANATSSSPPTPISPHGSCASRRVPIVYDLVTFDPAMRAQPPLGDRSSGHAPVGRAALDRVHRDLAGHRRRARAALPERRRTRRRSRCSASRRPSRTSTPAEAPLPPPGFVLAVGTLEPRKNLPRLVDAYGRCDAATPGAPPARGRRRPRLARRGRRSTRCARSASAASCSATSPTPRWRSSTAAARSSATRRSDEGFGLPVLEAMAAGRGGAHLERSPRCRRSAARRSRTPTRATSQASRQGSSDCWTRRRAAPSSAPSRASERASSPGRASPSARWRHSSGRRAEAESARAGALAPPPHRPRPCRSAPSAPRRQSSAYSSRSHARVDSQSLAALARAPAPDRLCRRSRVLRRDHLHAWATGENVVDARARREDHRRSRGDRLQRRETPRVALAQDHEHVGGGVGVLQLGVGQRSARQRHAVAQLARGDLRGQPVRVGRVDVVGAGDQRVDRWDRRPAATSPRSRSSKRRCSTRMPEPTTRKTSSEMPSRARAAARSGGSKKCAGGPDRHDDGILAIAATDHLDLLRAEHRDRARRGGRRADRARSGRPAAPGAAASARR